MRESILSIDSANMSRSAWDGSAHMSGDIDGLSTSSSRQSGNNLGISRSQDDATVSYYFQRPQSENDLQAYGGGKRWAIGDDTLVEQVDNLSGAKSVSDLEREFHNISLGSDFSTKKFWEVDDGHVADGKGTMFSASSPWSPRQSTWSSPTTDHTVAQALQLSPGRHRAFQSVNLGTDMVDYVLGDPLSGKGIRTLQAIKRHDFTHDPDGDVSKGGVNKKGSKTSSPFEPIDNNNKSGDSGSELLMNGDDSFRVIGAESPLTHKLSRDDDQVSQPSVIGSTPTKKPPTSDSFNPILPTANTIRDLNVSQAYGLSSSLDNVLTFPDYSPMGPPLSIDSPAANQFSNLSAPPLDIYSSGVQQMGSRATNNNMMNIQASASQAQQMNPQPTQSHQQQGSLQLTMPLQTQQQMMPQQPPTPGGQPTQMAPFTIINNQPHQQFTPQQPNHLGQAQMSLPNQNNPNPTVPPPHSQQQQQQQQAMFTHPFVINNQDPYASVSMPITGPVLPTQYVQTPWGLYPASIIPPQAIQAQQPNQQMNNQQQRPPSGQRPLTPGQQMSGQQMSGQQMSGQQMSGQQMSGDGSQQHIPQQQMQMPPNFVDMNGYPAIVAFYDHNGQLVTMNNRQMAGAPIRLVSPAPIMFNPAAPNTQQQQQGFNGTNAINYNNSNGGPPNINGIQMGHVQMNMSNTPQQMPMNASNTQNNFPQSINIQQQDFGMPQRQDSFGEDKFRVYHNMNAQSSAAGPLGLVQPPPPLTPPALGGNTGLGLGSGGRIYSTAPGAEGTFRNNMGPPHPNNSMQGGGMFNNQHRPNNNKEPVNMGRSRLLEEFRSNRIPNLQLKDLTHHVVEFSQDQHGSRFIQQKLERANMVEKQHIFSEILSAAYSLMTDVFGNYVIQKFFEFGLPEHRQTLAQRLTGHVLPLALQMYGCRVIQKALESIPPEMQISIVKELDGHVLKCVKDQNGNHVVQKCIECVDPNHLQFIIDAFRGQVYALSTHPYGCRVIQRILEHCLPDQTGAILSELHDQTDRLVLDQYGNYVIQHVLEHGRMDEKSKIVHHISGKILPLSQHKFASNVVEKCVSYGSRAEKAILIEEVCSVTEGGQSALYIMMKDQYANYVIQKMLDISEPNQRKILVHKIRPHVATLRKYTYGKHIIAKLEKYLMKNGGGDLSGSPLTLPMQ